LTDQQTALTLCLPAIEIQSSNTRRAPTIEWLKAPDGSKLGCRVWQGNENAPVVIHLHGIEGHSQWFENTASVLNENGITVYAPDRRGSGMNSNLRGHLDNYSILFADLESQIRYIRRKHRGQRVIMIANCWSAKLASIFSQSTYESTDHALIPPFAGLILTGPAIYTHVDFPFLTKLQIAFSWLLGNQTLKKYWPIPITTNMLTNDPGFIKFIENDTARLTKATTSFFVQTFFLSKKAQQAAKFIKMPVLILQGEDDQIVDIEKLEVWYEQIASTDKAIHAFPGASHSLDFDRTWFKEYTHLLCDWILTKGQLGI
jgi:acylglycerol lipase